MERLLQVEHLAKSFGHVAALQDVSFHVNKGEILGFLGPNGAGKTTAMRLMTGYLPIDHGNVVLAQYNIAEAARKAQQHFGYLPEGGPLYGDMEVLAFLRFIGTARKMAKAFLRERLAFVIEQLALQNVLYQPIDTLSKGFKRRVAFAQAILHDPEVLLLDEPTDGLDPNQKYHVHHLIKEMVREKAIVISTHILEEVEALCSRVLVIADGQVVSSGTPEHLARHSPAYNTVMLELQSPIQLRQKTEIIKTLQAMKSVKDVQCEKDNTVLKVIPKEKDQGVVDAIADVAKNKAWPVRQLYVKRASLEEAFRFLTHSGVRHE